MAQDSAPPAATGLSPWSAQVLGGFSGVDWRSLMMQLLGMQSQAPTLANLMNPLPQATPILPKPDLPLPVKVPVAKPQAAAAATPSVPPVLSFANVGGAVVPVGADLGFGVGDGTMGMGVTGQGAFGDLGNFGLGYGDTY